MSEFSNNSVARSDVYSAIWANKWHLVAAGFACCLIFGVYAWSQPDIYKAEVLLAPNQVEESAGLAGLAAQVGIPVGLTGLSLGDGSPVKKALGLEILMSRKFLTEFVSRHDILVPLMATSGWDAETGRVVIDPARYDEELEVWKKWFTSDDNASPTTQEVYDEMVERINVSDNDSSGFVRVSVEHQSPVLAKQWLDWLVEDVNATMLAEDVGEARRAIEFLRKQAESTAIADLRGIFFRLIEEKTKVVMLAEIREEYLFKTIDPAVIATEPVRPNRLVILILGAILGSGIATLLVLFRLITQQSQA